MASRKRSTVSTRSVIRAKSEAESSGYISDGDSKDPLSDDFDPASLKVPELRKVLQDNKVAAPSTLRKPGLIQAYEESIRPHLDELRAARERDQKGLKVEDPIEISVDSNAPVPSIKADRDTEASGNESESSLHSAMLSPNSPKRSRRSVSWAGDVSGPEDDDQEQQEEPQGEQAGNDSTFSVDNPFQSVRLEPGKKTTSRKVSHTTLSDKGVKTDPAAIQSESASTSKSPVKQPRLSATPSLFRNYMDPTISSSMSPRRAINDKDSPLKSRLGSVKRSKIEETGMDSGFDGDVSRDEFDTPSKSPRQQHKKRGGSNLSDSTEGSRGDEKISTGRSVAWLFISIISITWWSWYLSESRKVGFCDVGRSSNAVLDRRAYEYEQTRQAIQGEDDLANVTISVPLFLRPSCTACPAHAYCHSGYLSGCESGDYVLQNSLASRLPFSDFLLPLSTTAPICRPDEQKVMHAADLADEIEDRLRIRKGDVQCNRKVAYSNKLPNKPSKSEDLNQLAYSIPKSALHDELEREVAKSDLLASQSEGYFEELWTLALKDLLLTDRVGESASLLYAKRGAVGIDLRCWAGLLMQDIWLRLRIWVALLSALLMGGYWLRHRFQHNRFRKEKVKDMVASTLSRLEQAKRLNLEEESYLSISQLRDDVLRSETSESQKKSLWSVVMKQVEANSNVRTRQAKVKGEWSRVWEWVGTIDGRKAARTSTGRQGKENGHVIVNEGKERLESVDV